MLRRLLLPIEFELIHFKCVLRYHQCMMVLWCFLNMFQVVFFHVCGRYRFPFCHAPAIFSTWRRPLMSVCWTPSKVTANALEQMNKQILMATRWAPSPVLQPQLPINKAICRGPMSLHLELHNFLKKNWPTFWVGRLLEEKEHGDSKQSVFFSGVRLGWCSFGGELCFKESLSSLLHGRRHVHDVDEWLRRLKKNGWRFDERMRKKPKNPCTWHLSNEKVLVIYLLYLGDYTYTIQFCNNLQNCFKDYY